MMVVKRGFRWEVVTAQYVTAGGYSVYLSNLNVLVSMLPMVFHSPVGI